MLVAKKPLPARHCGFDPRTGFAETEMDKSSTQLFAVFHPRDWQVAVKSSLSRRLLKQERFHYCVLVCFPLSVNSIQLSKYVNVGTKAHSRGIFVQLWNVQVALYYPLGKNEHLYRENTSSKDPLVRVPVYVYGLPKLYDFVIASNNKGCSWNSLIKAMVYFVFFCWEKLVTDLHTQKQTPTGRSPLLHHHFHCVKEMLVNWWPLLFIFGITSGFNMWPCSIKA